MASHGGTGGGGGVTKYNVHEPTYGFTTATTQFDDALMKHGVITRTQALVAKGATVEQAQALLEEEKRAQQALKETPVKEWYQEDDGKKSGTEDDDDDDDDSYNYLLDDDNNNEEEDEILQRYRQLRMNEMQESATGRGGEGRVESICRDDWTAKVNEASRDGTWVVICLTTSSTRVAQHGVSSHDFIDACTVLAQRYRHLARFVTLPTTEALDGAEWPHPEPSLLVYRYGKLQHQFFRLRSVSVQDLEATLNAVWTTTDDE